MPNPNGFISTTVSVDRAAEGGYGVELDDGRRARLDPEDARSAALADVLESLARQRMAVYVELAPETGTITRLLVPTLGRVVGLRRIQEGLLDVELDASHARHTLDLRRDDAAELEGQLREVLGKDQPILLVDDDSHDIIDLRQHTPGPDDGPRLPPFPVEPPLEVRPKWPWPWLRWLLRPIWWIRWWLTYPWFWWGCISERRADQIFAAMASRSCNPVTVPPPCIPFLYPDNGCWARAHEMCRLMIADGYTPRKVWIRAATLLHAKTRNRTQCFVEWNWHVAPTLCVRTWWFWTRRVVIDPSLFTGPVAVATWHAAQGDPAASLTHTDQSQYWPTAGTTDPGYVETDQDLQDHRVLLQNRSAQQGPPPYAHCP